MRTKATLTLEIVYEGPCAVAGYIRSQLDLLVQHAVNNGLLTGDENVVAEEWSHRIDVKDFEEMCKRCEFPLKDGRCTNETCPFSDYSQDDIRGWAGHPDWNDKLERLGVYDGTYKPEKD